MRGHLLCTTHFFLVLQNVYSKRGNSTLDKSVRLVQSRNVTVKLGRVYVEELNKENNSHVSDVKRWTSFQLRTV